MKTMQFVVCVNNADYPASLELRKIYQVLPDAEAERLCQLRIIDESGEDYLYPASSFISIQLPKEVEAAVIRAA